MRRQAKRLEGIESDQPQTRHAIDHIPCWQALGQLMNGVTQQHSQ